MKRLKKRKVAKGAKQERRKEQKRIETMRQHLKVLIKYINKDYADVKNRSVFSPSHTHSRCCFANAAS